MENRAINIQISGVVQGVGFRPFVYSLACVLGIRGKVWNDAVGVEINALGSSQQLADFCCSLQIELPSAARITAFQTVALSPAELDWPSGFQIVSSVNSGNTRAVIPSDLALCPTCRQEILDTENRRYHYPFTNCTQCGPRFSIISALPYDRPQTSMAEFAMCPECLEEYEDPRNRRFHAQPNACPKCGPCVSLEDSTGTILAERHDALDQTVDFLQAGKIVAVKGLGGFHLMADATNEDSVLQLRHRKGREEKPFAVMVPDLAWVERHCVMNEKARECLESPVAPIVILPVKDITQKPEILENKAGRAVHSVPHLSCISSYSIAPSVSPVDRTLGIMLPYTPLHVLLLQKTGRPLIATSGNISDEPICTDNQEARDRLGAIADYFLMHNRRIVRPVDDSVLRVAGEAIIILRRSRGLAPVPVRLPDVIPPVLCCGAHLKNTVAVAEGDEVVVSQHIGDLENQPAREAFVNAIELLKNLYKKKPEFVICDAHPDYPATRYALAQELPVMPVQHHYAHILSAMAENGGFYQSKSFQSPAGNSCDSKTVKSADRARARSPSEPPALIKSRAQFPSEPHRKQNIIDYVSSQNNGEQVLGIAWDGTGYGLDGTIWGGEFLLCDRKGFTRIGHIRPFLLPGGDQAVKEPRRALLGLFHTAGLLDSDNLCKAILENSFSLTELKNLILLLDRRRMSPMTSSMGRLFDAVAALIGRRSCSTFEAQAAMEVEALAGQMSEIHKEQESGFPLKIEESGQAIRYHQLPPGYYSLPFPVHSEESEQKCLVADWKPLLVKMIADLEAGRSATELAGNFHRWLAEVILLVAQKAGCRKVVLSGGCFQNIILHQLAVNKLQVAGFDVIMHRQFSPNDGSIALGQACAAGFSASINE